MNTISNNSTRVQLRLLRNRRGVAAIEGVVVLSVLLMMLFVLFDFALATFQYNTLSAAARSLARASIVHGSIAAPQHTVWGPTEFIGNAGDGSDVAAAVSPCLATMSPSGVSIDITWPNGTNDVTDLVQVRLTYTHQSLAKFLPGISSMTITAQSTMSIAH